MKTAFLVVILILQIFPIFLSAQTKKKTDANVFGDVQSAGEHIPFVSIYLEGTTLGTTTDNTGHYTLINLPVGQHTLVASAVGYKTGRKAIQVELGKSQ